MTIQEIFQRLFRIDRDASALLEDTGFYSEDGLDGSAHPLPDIPEDVFLRDEVQKLPGSLEAFYEGLSYLKEPARGESSTNTYVVCPFTYHLLNHITADITVLSGSQVSDRITFLESLKLLSFSYHRIGQCFQTNSDSVCLSS